MRPIRRKRVGASDLSYSAGDPKSADIKASVTEHGYRVKIAVSLNYNALTERQGQQAHKLLFALVTDALSSAQDQRKVNMPLFDLSELDFKPQPGQGVNER